MKTEDQIRERVELLKKRSADPKAKRSAVPMLIAAEDALLWALGENEDELWSMQARLNREQS